jgi:hypothetical protein
MNPTEIIHQFAEQNMLVEKYLLGELFGADLEDFEQHMFDCLICFEEVKAGQAFTQHLAAAASTGELHGKGIWQRLKEFWFTHVWKSRESKC